MGLDAGKLTPLDPSQLDSFSASGYLVVPGLYSPAEMEEITAWTDAVADSPETPGKQMMYFEDSLTEAGKRILCRVENFSPWHDGFRRMFTECRMQKICSQLLQDDAVLFKEKINFKLPGGDGFKAHQDVQAGWDQYAALHVTGLLSIDPCTMENGCLEIASGMHKKGLLGTHWKPLEENALDYRPIPTRPGDAIFFDSFSPHRSAPNRTAHPRRVLYITWNKAQEGDHRVRYYAEKRAQYPPDCEREQGRDYVFRV